MDIKLIRRNLGITQEMMACLLETSRATISMVELGQRRLSSHSKRLLHELLERENNPHRTFRETLQLPNHQLEKQKQKSQKRLEKLEFKINRTKTILAKKLEIKSMYERGHHLIQQKQTELPIEKEKRHLALQIQQRKIKKRLTLYSDHAINTLEINLQLYEVERGSLVAYSEMK